MALRVPVITTRVSAIPELVEDGVTGRLVEVDDHIGFATALAEFAGDSRLAESYSEGARAKVEQLFNQEKNINELLDLFKQYTGMHWTDSESANSLTHDK